MKSKSRETERKIKSKSDEKKKDIRCKRTRTGIKAGIVYTEDP